jgi:hypothetical protein
MTSVVGPHRAGKPILYPFSAPIVRPEMK